MDPKWMMPLGISTANRDSTQPRHSSWNGRFKCEKCDVETTLGFYPRFCPNCGVRL